ncbi:MAG: hypothetical protein J3R72DRAFT_453193 [Linnemannia gamsii]|nr:MAG: hypothetical protein J3R72DRAFT_453193 [Linnemannia gamsii]
MHPFKRAFPLLSMIPVSTLLLLPSGLSFASTIDNSLPFLLLYVHHIMCAPLFPLLCCFPCIRLRISLSLPFLSSHSHLYLLYVSHFSFFSFPSFNNDNQKKKTTTEENRPMDDDVYLLFSLTNDFFFLSLFPSPLLSSCSLLSLSPFSLISLTHLSVLCWLSSSLCI